MTLRAHLPWTAALLAALSAGALLLSPLVACKRTASYVYSAQKYDPANDCLAAYAGVEVIDGDGVGSECDPDCLMVDGDLYVSTMCPPVPAIATEVPLDDPTCRAALAALARMSTCDAPVPADGGADASQDAADDASEPDAGARDAADGG